MDARFPIRHKSAKAVVAVMTTKQKGASEMKITTTGIDLAGVWYCDPEGIDAIAKRVPEILEDAANGLPGTMRRLLERLTDNLKEMNRPVGSADTEVAQRKC